MGEPLMIEWALLAFGVGLLVVSLCGQILEWLEDREDDK